MAARDHSSAERLTSGPALRPTRYVFWFTAAISILSVALWVVSVFYRVSIACGFLVELSHGKLFIIAGDVIAPNLANRLAAGIPAVDVTPLDDLHIIDLGFQLAALPDDGTYVLRTPMWLATLLWVAVSVCFYARARAIPRGTCPRCGYDCRFTDSARCSECGYRLDGAARDYRA